MYKQYEIVLVEFAFIDDDTKTKIRPCVIISSNSYNQETKTLLLAMITSAKKSKMWGDILIHNPRTANLKESSYLRLKFNHITDTRIIKVLGHLDLETQLALKNKLELLIG